MAEQGKESREAQAAREVGQTDVRPVVARGLTAAFLLVIGLVAASEIVRDAKSGSGAPWPGLAQGPAQAWPVVVRSGTLDGNRRLLSTMRTFEDALAERSLVAEHFLPHVQWILTHLLGVGNEQVVVGNEGWLYLRAAVDYLTGPGFLDPDALARRAAGGKAWEPRPQPNPLPALADFAAQLKERGIGLVVVVTPVKAGLHPEGLAPGRAHGLRPIENPSFDTFVREVAGLGIPVYAPAERLARTLDETSRPQFLRTDTHWTPEAMEDAARGLGEFLRRHAPLPERRPAVFRRQRAVVRGRGDLARLLRLPERDEVFERETVITRPVVDADGKPWSPDPTADVLLLGDSYTNVFSQRELGWGEGGGLAEQLSFVLQRPVDRLAVNAGGPAAARERLAALVAGDDRLAGKRLVLYQLAARELSSGDWRLVDLGGGAGEREQARRPEQGVPAQGVVAWESRRSGDWRIWTRRLEGSPPRQLTPDEPDRQHCCAHISPDGSRLVYLSRDVPHDQYPEIEVPGELRLVRLDGGGERTLREDARPYGWGNRAAVWRNDRELIFIPADGRTFLLDVDRGRVSPLTEEPQRKLAWLIDPTLRYAVNGSPAFSSYDAAARRILPSERLPGCEPYFSHDGRLGFWVARGGGPVRWMDLASRATGTLIDAQDPRLSIAQRYVYFPMLSRDNRMLAFGASQGDHDHYRADYDVFVAPVEPTSLELLGRPLRLSSHPASDRYPDVHLDRLDLARWRREAPLPSPDARESAASPQAKGAPFEVRASLVACSRVPSLREIAPYRSALIACEWQVSETLEGEAPGTRLHVAHWAVRDGRRQVVTSLAPGFEARLLLGDAQVEGYPVFDTLPGPRRRLHYSRGL